MFNDHNLSYTIIKRTIVYTLIIIGIILLSFKEPKPYVLGFVFGTSIGILGFRLLELTIRKAVTMPPKRASAYTMGQYMIRYFIYGIVLVVAALADYLSFPAAVLGLLMIKIVIITYAVYDNIISNVKKSLDKMKNSK
jgi:DMSO reductase anchor subunit